MSTTIQTTKLQQAALRREERQRYRATHYPKPGDEDYHPQWDPNVMEKYAGQCIVWYGGKIVSADIDSEVAIAKARDQGVPNDQYLTSYFICSPENRFPPGW